MQTRETRNVVAVVGQLQQDAVAFKALMMDAGYTLEKQAVDATTRLPTTTPATYPGVLYGFGNIHSAILKTVVNHTEKPLVHISTYPSQPGDTRFIAIFDTATKRQWQDQKLLSGTNLDSQLDEYATLGYLPTLITPWFIRKNLIILPRTN